MPWIKKTYLYLVSLVSLIIIIIGATMLVNMGIKAALGVKDYVNYPQMCASAPITPNGDKNAICDPDFQKKQAVAEQENQTNSKKRDVAQALAFLVVGSPIFWYHWSLARKEA
jgi:hypothetical protein